MMRLLIFGSVVVFGTLSNAAETVVEESVPTALNDYVQRKDDVFQWQLVNTTVSEAGTVYELRVTSQKWQDIVWKHAVEIYKPKEVRFPRHALLFVTGGSTPSPPKANDLLLGGKLAADCGACVVMLHQTPNQPLLGNRREDDLISESWLRYLDSGDRRWPLLFPMVKSAVRAIDATQAFSAEAFDQKIDQFVISGASKRGWTSWLAPVADERIIATAPIVIDVLNFRAQMNHQIKTWGSYSPQIVDYTSKGLVKGPGETESDRELTLRMMMDPYTYRKQLTLPKLLIVGTNDPYWVVDSMNLYWDDLIGAKYVRQVPNAGHGLEGGRDGALASLAAFFRHVASDRPMPTLSWTLEEDDQRLQLTMSSDTTPSAVYFWTAGSDDNDFRDAKWSKLKTSKEGTNWIGIADRSSSDNVAVFGEFQFMNDEHPWSLTTLVYRR